MRRKQHSKARCPERTHVLYAVAIVLLFAALGCDNNINLKGLSYGPTVPPLPSTGPMTSKTRAIAGVDRVELHAVGLVSIDFGAAESLTITAPESVIALLTSEVVDGALILGRNSPNYQGHVSDIHYDIALQRLDRLSLHGVGEMVVEGVETDFWVVVLDGVGDIRASGRVDRQTVDVAGLGRYFAPDLESRVTEVDLTRGRAVVWATERLEGRVAAGCVLEYWGSPEIDVRGQGEVHRLGSKP